MTTTNTMNPTTELDDASLDDLKRAWKTLDACLHQQNALQLDALRDRKLGRVRASLRPLAIGQTVQILFGIVCVLIGVGLWKTFYAIVPVLLAGIVLHVYGVVTIAAAGIVLGGISRIDRSLPVLELQRRLAKLRRSYILSGMAVGLPWWGLWMLPPMVIVSLQNAKNGVDGLPMWLWISLLVCALAAIGTLWFHRWSHRPGREALAKRVDDAAAGGSLRRAQAELNDLERYVDGEDR
ncbi:MAG: serine/threonine protein kinase [Lysobacter sp.]|nr:serine/threonine protein kinase [Lysobacter sp.]